MAISKENQRLKEKFKNQLLKHVGSFNKAVSTADGDWVVKGFIDIAKNIYTISVDTKVISKIMELLLFPKICHFAEEYGYRLVLCKEQNFYPDISLVDKDNHNFALDLKSTYRKNKIKVNGMTLGAFTGYFRNRQSTKNITFPYNEYIAHFVLGVVYSRTEAVADERNVYQLNDLRNITSVIKDFAFFLQEKYQIALDRPGSGNTRNIGSVTEVARLIEGKGPFAKLGENVFDDYWMYYLTNDMARAAELKSPAYRNLQEYKKYKKLGI
ncbi:MAG TPA: type II restriction endonuclease [Sedimentisphaerales bacterium]|nr:type II restriction endonuclease [Sedimentisphaerales bacterium]